MGRAPADPPAGKTVACPLPVFPDMEFAPASIKDGYDFLTMLIKRVKKMVKSKRFNPVCQSLSQDKD
jgi:hypothetical protein